MAAYYNEFDPFAAAWLRELIKAGLIADGEVDERSIADVAANDVRGFTQCHFFAGIGGWSYALRLAGWPDDREVWTGSCPCQPWSVAGFGTGTADPRHLWPSWQRLIEQCRPTTVFGEQVASEDGKYWCDLVCADVEAMGYAFGAGVLPATCVGAPEGRHRLWFVADAPGSRSSAASASQQDGPRRRTESGREGARMVRCMGDAGSSGLSSTEQPNVRGKRGRSQGRAITEPSEASTESVADANSRRQRADRQTASNDDTVGESHVEQCDASTGELANTSGARRQQIAGSASRDEGSDGWQPDGDHVAPSAYQGESRGVANSDSAERSYGDLQRSWRLVQLAEDPLVGFWSGADWLRCDDGKIRPVEPGTFPLAHGLPARVGRLRGYGNAIVPEAAQVFIEAYLDCERGLLLAGDTRHE